MEFSRKSMESTLKRVESGVLKDSVKQIRTLKTFTKLNLGVLLAVGLVFSASGIPITPGTLPQWIGNDNSNLSASQIATIVGEGSLTEVYKKNVGGGGGEDGSFASSYSTTFFNAPNDPADALIDYISGPSITGGSIYLYVKDGSQTPAFYIFDISTWNGTDDLNLTGFWPQQGAISHIAILTGAGVPDAGSTLSLFGLALGCLSLGKIRQKLGRSA